MAVKRTWNITKHALDRFVERFAPRSFDDEAEREMHALLADGVEVGRRDTGDPKDRGVLVGTSARPEIVFLCRPDAFSAVPGQWVCVTTLDSHAHRMSFRGAKGGVTRRMGGRGRRMR